MTQKKSSLKRLSCTMLVTAGLLSLASCGGDSDGDSDYVEAPATPQAQEQTLDGVYRLQLTSVNPLLSPTIAGTGSITVDPMNVRVMMDVTGAPAGIHMQHIHLGTSCPTMAADVNGDGYVDAAEAAPISGPMLIPLDGNLSSQDAGHSRFPSGSYRYDRSARVAVLQSDLWAMDLDSSDSLVKLPLSEELLLEGRVVEIHGVTSSMTLPETVGSIDGLPSYRTVPLACGVITREVIDGSTIRF